MNPSTDLTSREAEIVRVLRILTRYAGGFVVVGGYAVNALAVHRFSVDCDLVTDERHLSSLEKSLRGEGYQRLGGQSETFHGAKTRKYKKLVGGRPVSVDLFVKSLVCRQTGGSWGYGLIRRNSIEASVVGVTDSTSSLVPKRELLMAIKLHSGRDVDVRDVVMLSEGADWASMGRFLACGSKEKVSRQVESAIARVSRDDFASALRAEFSLRPDVVPLVKSTLEGLSRLRASLPQLVFSSSL